MISLIRQTTRAGGPARLLSSTALQLRDPNPELVDSSRAPSDYVSTSASVYRDFVTEEEANFLVEDIKTCMKR